MDEFKQQLVDLYRSGKRRYDICREYDIAHSLFDEWVKQAENSGSFHEKDNRAPEQEELIKLRKENQQLKMENDILEQVALILDEGKCDQSKCAQIPCISNVPRPAGK